MEIANNMNVGRGFGFSTENLGVAGMGKAAETVQDDVLTISEGMKGVAPLEAAVTREVEDDLRRDDGLGRLMSGVLNFSPPTMPDFDKISS